MGSFVELNDTLQITREQGFPVTLDLETHLKTPYKAEDFAEQIFSFKDKPSIRIYQIPPVRNFLVENYEGKWIYWGLCHVLSTTCDYQTQTTSGTFKIIYLNTADEMTQAFKLLDQRPEFQHVSKA